MITRAEDIGVVVRRSLRIKLGVAAAILINAAILVAARFLYPQIAGELGFVVLVTTASAGIYSAFYIAETLRIQVGQRSAQAAFELIDKFNDSDIRKVSAFVHDKLAPSNVSKSEMAAAITKDKLVHTALKTILNRLEGLAIAVSEGYADERILYKDFRTTVTWFWSTFTPYIEARRREMSPTFYENFEKLACSWSAKRYLFSGEAIEN